MSKLSKQFKNTITIIFLAWIISIGIIYIKAWVGPTSSPAEGSGAIAVDGSSNVGIGTTSPDGRLDVEGGDVFIGTGTLTNGTASEDLSVTGNIEVDGAAYVGGVLSMESNKITNLATPTVSTDAATMAYVDGASGGGTKIVKSYIGSASGALSIDCGTGYQIIRVSLAGSESNNSLAQAERAVKYNIITLVTAWTGVTYQGRINVWNCLGAQSCVTADSWWFNGNGTCSSTYCARAIAAQCSPQ